MLASDGPAPFAAPGWSYEIKFDGWRAFALVRAGRLVQLLSRQGNDLLGRWGELAAIADGVRGDDVLLDGEIIAGDGSMASFPTLLARVSTRSFVAFDCLAAGGQSLLREPIEARRSVLAGIVAARERLALSAAFDDGPGLFREAQARGFEGIVAKRAGSLYTPGARSRDWIKVKSAEAAAVIRERFER